MNDSHQLQSDKKDEFVIEYLKQLRGEITARVQINSNLILQKIATCGAALALLFSQPLDVGQTRLVSSETQLLGFLLIPIVAMLYDVVIARNINNVNQLAVFIRLKLEPLVPKVTLWETYLFEKVYKSEGYSTENILLSLFTLGTELITAVVYWNEKRIYLAFIVLLLVLHYFTFIFIQKLRSLKTI
ncbi:MAG: hypothetical protein KME20_25005 [Kaiparowitsia implicata GSE-PSE-MK54-09C]|jgi:hypothetical protein|nr:hypothetical protein [Kaiparowitsia implicata GSE-PSE-MK54-09C]